MSTPDFEAWLVENGKSPKTARNYAQAVRGQLSKWAIEADLIAEPLLDYRGSDKPMPEIVAGVRALDIFRERNSKGKSMYGAALRWLEIFTEERLAPSIVSDIELLVSDPSLESTERRALVAARVGQGVFRSRLFAKWGGCAATGYAQASMLVASHIKPWRLADNMERLDVHNGLLLVPSLDRAFDRAFVSFDGDGRILISAELESPSELGVHSTIRIRLEEAHQPYLEFHRQRCFRR